MNCHTNGRDRKLRRRSIERSRYSRIIFSFFSSMNNCSSFRNIIFAWKIKKDIVSNDLINDTFYKTRQIHIDHLVFSQSIHSMNGLFLYFFSWGISHLSFTEIKSIMDNKQTVADILLQMGRRNCLKNPIENGFFSWGEIVQLKFANRKVNKFRQ